MCWSVVVTFLIAALLCWGQEVQPPMIKPNDRFRLCSHYGVLNCCDSACKSWDVLASPIIFNGTQIVAQFCYDCHPTNRSKIVGCLSPSSSSRTTFERQVPCDFHVRDFYHNLSGENRAVIWAPLKITGIARASEIRNHGNSTHNPERHSVNRALMFWWNRMYTIGL